MPTPQPIKDADLGFIGIDTRTNPAMLKQGFLQDGRNIRIEESQIFSRKGIKSLLSKLQFSEVGDVLGTGIYTNKEGVEKIVLVVEDGLYLFDINTGLISQKYTFPTGRKAIGKTDIIQAVDKLYVLRGESTKQFDSVSVQSLNSGHTIVEVTCSEAHGLQVGDEFSIHTNHPQFNGSFLVSAIQSANVYRYVIPVGHNASGTGFVDVGRPVLVWSGTTSLSIVPQVEIDGSNADFPMTGTAIYHKNRIYCKVSKDEIAVSDYLTDDNGNWKFDRTIQQMVINEGDGQEIIGFYPWTQDQVLVFKQRSIYTVKFGDNTTSPEIALDTSYVQTLSSDIGCVSKRSIASLGTKIFFLSQKGVYAIEPQLDVKLLANTVPLSRPIQKYIDRINTSYLKNSTSVVYNGRFYLGLTIDDSTTNNFIFVFNLLNEAWESIDTYPEGVDIDNMHLMYYNNSQRLIFADFEGAVFLSEEKEYDEFGIQLEESVGQDLSIYREIDNEMKQGIPLPFELIDEDKIFGPNTINAYVLTRSYNLQSFQQKRFSFGEVSMSSDEYCLAQIGVKTKNPDTYSILDFTTFNSSGDSIEAYPIRKTAVESAIEIKALSGRFGIQSVVISARAHGENKRNKT
jgi:hypothetical protein